MWKIGRLWVTLSQLPNHAYGETSDRTKWNLNSKMQPTNIWIFWLHLILCLIQKPFITLKKKSRFLFRFGLSIKMKKPSGGSWTIRKKIKMRFPWKRNFSIITSVEKKQTKMKWMKTWGETLKRANFEKSPPPILTCVEGWAAAPTTLTPQGPPTA